MRKKYILFLLFYSTAISFCQKIENQSIMFKTQDRNMWGEGTAFTFKYEFPFYLNWSENFGPYGGIKNFDIGDVNLGDWGARISGGTSGKIGARFFIQDVSGGSIDVDYPINAELTLPNDNSFNRGEWINIDTKYAVDASGAILKSNFPNAGKTGLEFTFNFYGYIHPKICAYSCIEPNVDINIAETFYIFYLDKSRAVYPCVRKEWCSVFPQPCAPDDCPKKSFCYPSFCEKNLLPVTVSLDKYGITGTFDLPATRTTSSLSVPTRSLYAQGDSNYATLDLDIPIFMSNFAPPNVKLVLQNLKNEYNSGPIHFRYNFLSSNLLLKVNNKQKFSFNPTVYITFIFPAPIDFRVKNPSNPSVNVSSGRSTTIRLQVDHRLEIKYPCNYEFMKLKPKYDITNTFRNKTYDSIYLDLTVSALAFELAMSSTKIFDGIYVDEVCFLGVCTPGFWLVPKITVPGFSFPSGGYSPLYDDQFHIGGKTIEWFNKSWELKGFTEQIGPEISLEPKIYVANITSTNDVKCNGGNSGKAIVNITNGVAPFTLFWSDGSIRTTSSRIDSLTILRAGEHSVLIRDAVNCETPTTFIIKEPLSPLEINNYTIKHPSCFGSNNGEIHINTSGGTPPYNYSWGHVSNNNPIVTGLVSGNYSLTISDKNGCSIKSTYILTSPSALQLLISTTNVKCYGESTGTALSTVSGGVFPYSYSWSNGTSNSSTTNLPNGNHSLTITDAQGCNIIENFTIIQPSNPLVVTPILTHIKCYAEKIGEVSLVTTGGTSPYLYKWVDEKNIVLSNNKDFKNKMSAGKYSIFITDGNNCKDTAIVQLNQPSLPLYAAFTIKNADCFGDSLGSISTTVSGGTSPYNYSWSNGKTTSTNLNIKSGNYILTITDDNNCKFSDTLTITEPNAPLLSTYNLKHISCFGLSNGKITVSTQGGTNPYTYNWTNGFDSSYIDKIPSGNYTLTTTDAHGCTLLTNYTLTQPDSALIATENLVHISCYGFKDGSINLKLYGGTKPYKLKWTDSLNRYLAYTSSYLTKLEANNYKLELTDKNACKYTNQYKLKQPDKALLVKYNTKDATCYDLNNGEIATTVLGGTTPYTYKWNNNTNNPHLQNVKAAIYSATITDAHNCSVYLTDTIHQPETPLMIEIKSTDVSCLNNNNGSLLATVNGGTYPYKLNWSNGETTEFIDKLKSGTYTLTISDKNNCLAFSGGIVNEPDSTLEIKTIIKNSSCFNYWDGSITISPIGGTPPYRFYWGDSLFLFSSHSNTFSHLHANDYYVKVIDNNNCISSKTITITQPDTLLIDHSIIEPLCFGNSNGSIYITIKGGTQPYNYLWSNGQNTKDIKNIPAETYKVIVTDSNKCMVSSIINLTQPKDLLLHYEITPVSCKDNSDGSINLSVYGGTEQYSYLWSNEEFTQDIFNLAPGTYIVKVIDQHDCEKTDTIVINSSDIACIGIPNVFSPNGDGINDTWNLNNIGLYPNAEIKVYNQWGKMVYSSQGIYESWDGRRNGILLPSSTYYYIIDLKDGTTPISGSITIIK